MMKILVFEHEKDVDAFVAETLIAQINRKADSTIGFATGATPLGTYKNLIQAYCEQRVDFAAVKAFNLDEYVGLSQHHPCSFAKAMKTTLFDLINIPKSQIFALHGDVPNMEDECKAYDILIDKHPIDIQLLGIGMDGHIAYNEPGTSFASGTHVVDLHNESIASSLSYGFDHIEDVPKQGVTQGIATIMNAKQLVMIAKGIKKHKLVEHMILGEIEESFPSTIIREHTNVIVVLDKEAASSLKKDIYEKR